MAEQNTITTKGKILDKFLWVLYNKTLDIKKQIFLSYNVQDAEFLEMVLVSRFFCTYFLSIVRLCIVSYFLFHELRYGTRYLFFFTSSITFCYFLLCFCRLQVPVHAYGNAVSVADSESGSDFLITRDPNQNLKKSRSDNLAAAAIL